MKLTRAAIIAGLLATTSLCWASTQELVPRTIKPKIPSELLRIPDDATGLLIVKFRDEVQARALGSGRVISRSRANLDELSAVCSQFGLVCKPAINHNEERLQELQVRAERYSGKAQPDLGGMIHVSAPAKTMLDAARALNDLNEVEWIEFETRRYISDCGDEGTGDCFDLDGTGSPWCETDEDCCTLVGSVYGPCDDEFGEWDTICAYYAHLLCEIPVGADRCLSIFNGSCYEGHGTGGCNDTDCCNTVCAAYPGCCEDVWDEQCAEYAYQLCNTGDPEGSTPDYTARGLQGYLTFPGYDPVPVEYDGLLPTWPDGSLLVGYDGQGYYLDSDTDPYGGLYGLGLQLYEEFGIDAMGMGDEAPLLLKGKTINVAVIEWGFYTGHEDLDVIIEPGQTVFEEYWSKPNHGTACLGIINAQDNDMGMIGIAPEAQAYFFPLTSVEEGPRELTAWTSALLTLLPGDVISCSYGGDDSNLNTVESTHTLIELAADLGIIACVAAGNDCYNLDGADNPDPGDVGGAVIGAGSPGFPHYRLAFSNFYQDGDDGVDGDANVVHFQAWGQFVATLGYGDLQLPGGDTDRAYTLTFNGTSAAAPQAAGIAACLQGLAKQFYGIPLPTTHLRQALMVGIPQSWGDPRFQGGFPDDLPCGLDTDPESGPNLIGNYTVPAGGFSSAAGSILNQWSEGFNDSPLVDEIITVTGTKVVGNVFSIKGSDSIYYVVDSEYIRRGHRPDPVGGGGGGGGGGGIIVPEIAQLRYLATGNVTDVVVVGHADIPVVNSMTVTTEFDWPGIFTLIFIEAYDWVSQRWSFVDVQWMAEEGTTDDGDHEFEHIASATQRFVRDGDGRILIRSWSLGFTGIGGLSTGGAASDFRTKIDLVNITISEEFGEPLP